MNKQVKQSVKDVIPTYNEEYPSQLLSLVDSLYLLSLQKKPTLPKRAEIARYHICAYVAIEKYQGIYDLPTPETYKIPLQPKVIYKLLDEFRENLLSGMKSPSSTPKSKRISPMPSAYTTPESSPSKLRKITSRTTPLASSPLKRLQALRDDEPSSIQEISTSIYEESSPFNPKERASPARSSKSVSSTPTNYKYDKKHITVPDFISFANNFYIPSPITAQMIVSFMEKKHKFSKKSEWLLACGMIYAAYIRINHQLLDNKLGANSQFQDQLFQYQKGGLMKWNMLAWCNIIEDSVKQENWIRELEHKFVFRNSSNGDENRNKETKARIGTEFEILDKLGSMVSGGVLFNSDNQTSYYRNWTARVASNL
ncbi:uncharacterized protein PRCAT00001696001 [Priceomyces carsonii]|uniref:uncharacterized protein n=1 Tax=Priceomyces carsonii TaxID=28549 RepID=UPI002ED9BE97|nr:unnamed protein product [Priceomyces carsonii]